MCGCKTQQKTVSLIPTVSAKAHVIPVKPTNQITSLTFTWVCNYITELGTNEVTQLVESSTLPPTWKPIWQGHTNTVTISIESTQPQMFYNFCNILLP